MAPRLLNTETACEDTFACGSTQPECQCSSPAEQQVRENLQQFPEQLFWQDLSEDCALLDSHEIELHTTAVWWLQMDAVLQMQPGLREDRASRDALRFEYVQQVKAHRNSFPSSSNRPRRPLLVELLRQAFVAVRLKLGFNHPW